MTNKEKFLGLVKKKDESFLKDVKERIENRDMLRESQNIAIKILERLKVLDWSQADLARELGVSAQQVTKYVSGKTNFELSTQIKIQKALNIPILASCYEKMIEDMVEALFSSEKFPVNETANIIVNEYTETRSAKVVKIKYDQAEKTYSSAPDYAHGFIFEKKAI